MQLLNDKENFSFATQSVICFQYRRNLITDMKFVRGKMGMLTILLLILMKGTDGPPVPPNTGPPVPPNTGPPETVIKACTGADKKLMTKDESAQEDILTSQWIFRKGNASNTTADIRLCNRKISGLFMVNPLYSSKVEQCNTTSIILKNTSFHDVGYYMLESLKEKNLITHTLPIFLSVSDTPTKQCKPDIRILSGKMLNCSTQCEQFDVEWTRNKDVVGNGSILLVDCLRKNESFLCCLKSKDMECYKGEKLDLCEPIPANYCTENRPGENIPDVHSDKVPDNPGSKMYLLALLIIPVILVVIYLLHRKGILPYPTLRRDKSIPCCSVSTQEPQADNKDVQEPEETDPMLSNGQKPHADDNDVHVLEDTVPMFANGQKPHADDNDVQVLEMPSPILGTVQDLDADVKLDEIKERTFPILDADGHQVQQEDPVHETEEAGTELQPNSETMREIQELRHAVMCKICFVHRMNMLFIPCNHMATCDKCNGAIEMCPICRAKIEKKEKIHYE